MNRSMQFLARAPPLGPQGAAAELGIAALRCKMGYGAARSHELYGSAGMHAGGGWSVDTLHSTGRVPVLPSARRAPLQAAKQSRSARWSMSARGMFTRAPASSTWTYSKQGASRAARRAPGGRLCRRG